MANSIRREPARPGGQRNCCAGATPVAMRACPCARVVAVTLLAWLPLLLLSVVRAPALPQQLPARRGQVHLVGAVARSLHVTTGKTPRGAVEPARVDLRARRRDFEDPAGPSLRCCGLRLT